jgi:ABC-type Fe3+ transport system substrate-binding protein
MGKSVVKRLMSILCIAAVVVLAACSSSSQSTGSSQNSAVGKPGGDITVYGWTGNWDLWFKDWATRFKDQTGITIHYISGPGTAMRQRITAEKASKADIFVGTPSDNYTLAQQGMLADIPWDQVPSAKYIDAKFKAPQVAIWGYDMQLLAYNSKYLTPDQAPKSWKELADPKWKGKIGMPAPSDEGATRSTLVMIDKYGKDEALKLTGQMYKNAKLTFNNPGLSESSLATGDTQVNAISMGSAMVILKEVHASVKTVVPSEGAFLMLNSIAMMKNAPNKAGALAFLKFFLGDSMQSTIMNDLGISIAVDSNVKLTNKDLGVGLGGETPAEVLKTAYVPDWRKLVAPDASGKSQLSTLYDEIATVATG